MFIISINRKLLKLSLIAVLIISLSYSILICSRNVELTNKYESIQSISNQFYQTSLITFFASNQRISYENKLIEIFDITKDEVIKKVMPDSPIRQLVISYLNEITGMYVKVNALPDKGYIIRVPMDPPVKVKIHWLNDYNINTVDEAYILLPENDTPFLLVMDKKSRPFFYNFNGNINLLLQNLDFISMQSEK